MKFKVGDKVRVREDLELCHEGSSVIEEMLQYAGKEATITKSDICYKIDIDNGYYNWDDYMFEDEVVKTKKTAKSKISEIDIEKILKEQISIATQNIAEKTNSYLESNEKLNETLDKLVKKIDKRTIYDESLIESVKKEVEKISTDELLESINKKVDKYISKNYGVLPRKIELQNGTTKKEITGLFHKKFDTILNIINKGVPLMLTGPAGAGKNYTLEQVAKALDLDFYFTNAVTQEFKLTGFIDANGVYQETQFYKAFKNGGLFFLDEVDASCPEALIVLNSAIANGYFDFPNGKVEVNEKFRVACAGNTYGTGADIIYVGRNQLDGATLDRFAVIEFNYDEEIEKQLAYDEELYNFISYLRKAINKNSLRYIVSMRATINATKLLEIGIPKKEIIITAIIKNMQIDDLNIIRNDISKYSDNNEWVQALKEIINARS